MTETLDGVTASRDTSLSVDDAEVRRAIELAWREADLLDRKAYEEWQELYADDAIYVIPIDRDAEEFDDVLNMVYDDKRMRQMRVTRMTEGYAIAAVDSAVTARTVSSFVPTSVEVSDGTTTVGVRAAQVVIAYKRDRHDIWAGHVDYLVRLGDERHGDRIVRKVIRLVDADAATPAAGFLL